MRYTGSATCVTNDQDAENVVTGSYSAGTLNDDQWTGINVPLTKEHPSVKCTATVTNNSIYTAYLRSISTNAGATCADNSGSANATTNANNVCAKVNVVAQFGSVATDKIEFGNSQPTAVTNTSGSITANGTSTVTVTITLNDVNTIVVDEDVVITLPTITHVYSTAQTGATGE